LRITLPGKGNKLLVARSGCELASAIQIWLTTYNRERPDTMPKHHWVAVLAWQTHVSILEGSRHEPVSVLNEMPLTHIATLTIELGLSSGGLRRKRQSREYAGNQ
jgi:hypothetical protein